MLKNLKLGMKMGLGFTLISFVLVLAVITTIFLVGKTNKVTDHLFKVRSPKTQSVLMTLNGVNHSLAALRGWIILGEIKFKEERIKAWEKEIKPSLEKLEELILSSNNAENKKAFHIIQENLQKFAKYQKEIEDIAQTPDNTPVMKVLNGPAMQQKENFAKSITAMINEEFKLEASVERKQLLGMMADIRGSGSLAFSHMQFYLNSGKKDEKVKYKEMWDINDRRFADLTDNMKIFTQQQHEAYDKLKKAREQLMPLFSKMISMREQENWNLANTWLGTKAAPTAFLIKEHLGNILERESKLMNEEMTEAKNLVADLATAEWILLFAGIFLSIIIGVSISRSISKPINKTVNDLAATASQIAATVDEHQRTMAQQSAAVSETTTTTEELDASSRQSKEQAETAASSASQTLNLADEGMLIVKETLSSMEDLKNKVGAIAEQILRLSEQSNQIGDITNLVTDIANQTNMLALNAAVEAARAGEHGKGFAVVAGEIRKLANQSKKSAEQIKTLVANIQKTTHSTVIVTEEGSKTMAQGTQLVKTTLEAFQKVAHAMNIVVENVEQIALNAKQQSEAIKQVSEAMINIKTGAKETSEGISQTRIGVDTMNRATETLKAMV